MPTVKQLKAQAKARGMKGYSNLKKAELELLLRPVPKPRSKLQRPIPPPRTTSLGTPLRQRSSNFHERYNDEIVRTNNMAARTSTKLVSKTMKELKDAIKLQKPNYQFGTMNVEDLVYKARFLGIYHKKLSNRSATPAQVAKYHRTAADN